MNRQTRWFIAGTLAMIGLGGPLPAHAADWSSNSLWYLHGNDFELGDRERGILRFEHADGWKYGDNYYFFDVVESDPAGTSLYGEFAPRFSLGKISGHDLAFGPVRDVLLTAAVNVGSNDFRTYLYGAGMDFSVPGFSYFQLNVYVRNDLKLPGTAWQVTPIWLYPFKLGSLQFALQGFIDYASAEGPAAPNFLAVPRLWLDLGALWGAAGRLEAGFEYFYWRNKFGIDGVTESVLQPSIKWTF